MHSYENAEYRKKVKLKQQNIEHFIAVTQQSESEEVKHTKKKQPTSSHIHRSVT